MAGSHSRLPKQMKRHSRGPAWNDPSPTLRMTYASYNGGDRAPATSHGISSQKGGSARKQQAAPERNRPSQAGKASQKAQKARRQQAHRRPEQQPGQSKQPGRQQQRPAAARAARQRSLLGGPFAVLLVAVLASAAVMAFGNPVLWSPASQDGVFSLNATSNAPQTAVLGEYQTASQSDIEERATNLSLAAQALDGQTIQPGATLSINDILGDTALDSDYLPAPTIVNGAVVMERGGGVCQVATTLYIAALHAGLQVEERHPHTLVSDYAPIGFDATIAYGSKDLKIRNDTNGPVQVSAFAQGQTVYVSISGSPRAGNVTYDVRAEVTDTFTLSASEAAAKYGIEGLDENAVATFYTVESYVVKSADGVEQEATLLSTDTYLAPAAESGQR